MYDDERANTQERDRVGKVAKHRFQQFKHALHQVVAHAACGFPRLALDHRGQQLGKQQQDQTGHHANDRHDLRHKRERTHVGTGQIYAAQVGDNTYQAVGREDELAPFLVAGVGVHIQHHCSQHQNDADVNGDHQDAGDGIHDRNGFACHANGVVERVQGILIAEEGTIDQAEDRTGDAAGDHQVEQVVVLDLPHKGAEQCQHDTLPDITEHHAKQHGEGERYEAGDICLAIGGQTVHLDEKLKRAAPPGVFQFGGGRHLTGGLGAVHGNAQVLDGPCLTGDFLHIRRRDPADAEEVGTFYRSHAAQVVHGGVVAHRVVQHLHLGFVVVPQGRDAGVDLVDRLLDDLEVLFKVLDDLGRRTGRAGHMHRLEVEHREDAVRFQRFLSRGQVDAPVAGLGLGTFHKQDVRVVGVVAHQLVVALGGQEAEAHLDMLAVQQFIDVNFQVQEMAVLGDAILTKLLLVQQALALGAQVVDLFQQIAQIGFGFVIGRVGVALLFVQLHASLLGHRFDLVAGGGIGVFLVEGGVSQRIRHITGGGFQVKPAVHTAGIQEVIQLGQGALYPHQLHLFNQSVHTPFNRVRRSRSAGLKLLRRAACNARPR